MKKLILITIHKGCFGKEIDRMYQLIEIKNTKVKEK